MKYMFTILPTILFTVLIFLLWEVLVTTLHINQSLLPAPHLIFQALITNWDIIAMHTWQTMIETLIGLVLAIILGVGMAVFLDMFGWIRKTLYPLLITSQTIPMIALAPLLLIWFGFDLTPKVIMVVLYCFFPITIATLSGLSSTQQEQIDLLESMGATQWQIFRLVKFPASLPSFFSGLKIAATYSITGAIVGEYVGGFRGLGIYMQTSANSHAVAIVFAAILVTALLSLGLVGIVLWIERLVLGWEYIK